MLSVLGEALIDLVCEPDGRFAARPGGSPMNVAVGLARLGLPTSFMARLSGDAFGRTLRAHVARNGVGTENCMHAGEPTTLAVVSLDSQGRAEYDFYVEGTADWQWTDTELRQVAPATTVFHTGSIASWTGPGAARIWAAASRLRESGVLITYDPNARPRLMGQRDHAVAQVQAGVSLAHVVKCSDQDLEFLYPTEEPATVVDRWLTMGPELVIVTLGSDGATGALRSGRRTQRPSIRVTVADTIGAGDAFMSGLLAGLYRSELVSPQSLAAMSDEQLDAVIDDAVLSAALTCERPGADPPTAGQFAAAQGRRTGRGQQPGQ